MNRKRRKLKKNSLRILFIGGLLIAVVFLSRATWNLYQKNSLARESRNDAEQEFANLENRYEGLSADLSRLQTDHGLEEELRTKFQVSKPGEHTIVLLDPKQEEDDEESGEGFWRSLINFFK